MYCTYLDLVERFGSVEMNQLTNQAGSCPATSSAIADAQSVIDSYIGARYQLPIETVPAVLKMCGCELARYYLWDDKTTDHIRQRYDDVIAMLISISKGTMTLPLPDATQPIIASNNIRFISTPPVWSRGVML